MAQIVAEVPAAELQASLRGRVVEPLDPGQKPALPQFDQSFDLEKKQAPEKPSSPRPSEPKRD